MRYLIMSDTHGNYPLAIRALELAGRIDRVFHLGDGIEDARLIEEITGHHIIKVPGNCDLSAPEPHEISAVFGGHRFFITHGDKYGVKGGTTLLHKKALEEQVRVVLYGHTHVASVSVLDGILFVNPGALRYKWPNTSYAILSVRPAGVNAELCPVAP